MPSNANDGHHGEIFKLGELHSSDGLNPATNQGGSSLRVGVFHVSNSNNAYWYLKWQGEMFYSHTAMKYMSFNQSSASDVTDYWGNPLGLGSTVLPGMNGPSGNMFNHSIQIPFAFTNLTGNAHDNRGAGDNHTDVANAYGYTSEPDWWYHPYAYANGGTITSSLHGIAEYDPAAANRSNTVNSALGEYFTMLRQPQKASRKDTSVCAWDDPTNGMHHVKQVWIQQDGYIFMLTEFY